MEPPIQMLYFLSGGAATLIFILLGARAVISFLSSFYLQYQGTWWYVPPLRTIFPYGSFLMSTSYFMIELYICSFMNASSFHSNHGRLERY
nr:dynein heavy chain 11, axonemal [Ipomoea batatas]GMD17351.1 dynein heavy chain 11, axonemal [Ipomoea batatas]GMD18815.1 dynein heavy chain 11, axonemal [Ipomoea batatas]